MNRTFEEDLDKLRTRLVRMGSLVEEQMEFAIRALNEGNAELAKIVTERDDKVDKLDLKIDKQCQRIFALNQPVASDLRLLLAAVKINNELERIGDMASDLASIVIDSPESIVMARRINFSRITSIMFKMLKASLDAFINNDPEMAAHILPTDSTVDTLYDSLRSEVVELMKSDATLIDPGASLLIALHDVERIADHATNIAENVIFLVEAKLVRHRTVNDEHSAFDPLGPLTDADND